jgi:hypothetical protein
LTDTAVAPHRISLTIDTPITTSSTATPTATATNSTAIVTVKNKKKPKNRRQIQQEIDTVANTLYLFQGPVSLLAHYYNQQRLLSAATSGDSADSDSGNNSNNNNNNNVAAMTMSIIWISLESKTQFIQRATNMIQNQFQLPNNNNNHNNNNEDIESQSKLAAKQIALLVDEAARDVTFFMQYAPLIDFTIINAP